MSNGYTEEWLANYEARRGVKMEIVDEPKPAKPLKYGNKKTEVDGIIFDSKREATRYQDLKLLENLGEISGIILQEEYPLIINGIKIASYRADFSYIENGQKVVEDTKSSFTRRLMWYRMKKKLMAALYGITIRET